MSKMEIFEGTIVQVDEPKAVGKFGNWKLGLQVETEKGKAWFSFLEKENVVKDLHKQARVGAYIKGIYEPSGDYRNVKKVDSVAPGGKLKERPGKGQPEGRPQGEPKKEEGGPREEIVAEDEAVALLGACWAKGKALLEADRAAMKEQYWPEVGRLAVTLFIEARRGAR